MEQKKIEKRQNEELSLACQFVARHYYNRAELFNYIIWGLCIISVLTIFIPDTTNWIILGIPLFLDIIVLALEKLFGDCISIAAKLRNYFDSYGIILLVTLILLFIGSRSGGQNSREIILANSQCDSS